MYSDIQSHFQYILRNRTEADILYWQSSSLDVRRVHSGKHASFSFTNPYTKKMLEFRLDGWLQAPGKYTLDEPGEFVIRLILESKETIKRDLLIRIKSKGLKRYVDFIALHKVRYLVLVVKANACRYGTYALFPWN